MPTTRSQSRALEAKERDVQHKRAQVQEQLDELITPVDHTDILAAFSRQFGIYVKRADAAKTQTDTIAPLIYMLEHMNLNLDRLGQVVRLKLSLIVHKQLPSYVSFCESLEFPDLKERLQAAIDRSRTQACNCIYRYPQDLLQYQSDEDRAEYNEAYAQVQREVGARTMQDARDLVLRAREREGSGGRLLPRNGCKDPREAKDASKLGEWKLALRGKGNGKCSDELLAYLDADLPGWRE
jgi:hypothetical protein